jgi:hypothetical protein
VRRAAVETDLAHMRDIVATVITLDTRFTSRRVLEGAVRKA